MFVRRSLIVLALTLAVVRCTDQPTALQRSPHVPQFVRWAANVAPQFTAISPQSNQHGRPGFRTPPLSLDTYSVSFWAVRGESRSVQINYSSAIDTLTHPFMQLTVTDPTFAPGQGDIAVGDSVLVTVNIDTTKIGLTLEPTGLQFGERAQLRIWYGGALGDLNGDGVVDSLDTGIENQLLGLAYRESSNDAWARVPASQSLDDHSFTSALPHFCDFAIDLDITLLDWTVSW
ncbi:MAG: hypothetical protein AUI08_11150 [Gemmatimonadetes bacterium 13_2_20CM_2_65_7]|nr:MAG: hypothetical protein AUI08_11150 [Gemmatimonadetes bacterium 13_2_20CM_2_65_7]OLC43539.1 MAG: hypothetical protein AUH75_02680 [Gemmatimonadetes bacterium 13_1_40CM_4_65_7]OLD03614.1 MAG: hypothetical protein AUI89_01145 [Gemmatimonadetes bacterium 13_1_40CM_3_65_8]